jgi:AraC family transcriptional regulator
VTSLWSGVERALAERALEGAPARLLTRPLAAGEGWSVDDIVCTADHVDRPYEESRSHVAVALVLAGTFQYRSPVGQALMTPGSLLLGNPDEPFVCGHDHGAGDRCISFSYSRQFVEGIASAARGRSARQTFRVPHLPPISASTPLVARATAGLLAGTDAAWEELALEAVTRALELANLRHDRRAAIPPAVEARVTRVARLIERGPGDEPFTLHRLAREAGLSPYHFLRTFHRVTGATPHQYLTRTRLRRAATRLVEDGESVIDVAFDSGYADVSNFNHAFRREFGMSPRQFRRRYS